MKAILKFDLPLEQVEFNNALQGSDWKYVCCKMDLYLRKRVKYDEGLTEEQREVYEDMRGELWKMMNEENLNLYAPE